MQSKITVNVSGAARKRERHVFRTTSMVFTSLQKCFNLFVERKIFSVVYKITGFGRFIITQKPEYLKKKTGTEQILKGSRL